MPNYDQLRLVELAAISDFMHQLAEEQWDAPSLCDGWRVRDVISHMCVGYTTPMLPMLAKVARRGFNVPQASREESIAYGSAHTPKELLDILDSIHRDNIRRGISRVIKPKEGLVDHLIHHQDIRRPLGMPREMPADRLVAALDAAPGLGGFVGAKKRAKGLHLVAIDLDWTHGSGPDLRGSGEAILLALSGRAVALPELSGDGAEVLRTRLAA